MSYKLGHDRLLILFLAIALNLRRLHRGGRYGVKLIGIKAPDTGPAKPTM
jgi:hypothetical protein